MAKQAIIKLLTASGIGSRRNIAALIKRGSVAINGKVIESFNEPVDTDRDTITIDGKRALFRKEPDVYLMLNKPKGIVSSTSDDRGRKTVIDILPEKYRNIRIYPVGRLDKDSTGLVLLTNDGNLTFRLTHPRFEQEKEYLVQIDGELKPEEIAELAKGIYLDDGKTCPAKIRVSRYPPFSYSIAIHEGRKHQVRRMFAALGHDVLELKRIRLGSLRLNRLSEGETRELSPAEVESLSKGAMRQKVR